MSTDGANPITQDRRKKYGGPEAQEVQALTDQFFVTLRAHAAGLSQAPPVPPGVTHLQELLKSSGNWSNAYEAEQFLTYFYDSDTLQLELNRRVLESDVLPAGHKDWYEEQLKSATTDAQKRAILLRLINDLQWRYTVNEAKRGYSQEIMWRTSWMLCGTIIAALAAVVVLLGLIWNVEPTTESFWIQSVMLLLAAFSGAWGAAFSMMIGQHDRLEASSFDDVKSAHAWSLLVARDLIGVAAGLILYFFLLAGMLAGTAFPDIQETSTLIIKDIALLVVWCFIAGFSEKLVPHLLDQAENRVQPNSADQAPGNRQLSILADRHGQNGQGQNGKGKNEPNKSEQGLEEKLAGK